MKKNIVIILLILFVPLFMYSFISNAKEISDLNSSELPEIIKFSSPMCYECQELEKIIEEVYPKYSDRVRLKKIDVTQRNAQNQDKIKEYDVKLVPTTIFKDKKGNTLRRIEGSMQPKILENYILEQING